MFIDLFRLYKKNGYSARSPLEDFNTEVFAGILRLNPMILNGFIELLHLPEGEYEVKTQLRYSLINRRDCIIDLILISDHSIVFIESKVNSGEGWEQLDRYCEVLDQHFEDREKFLVYCTKYTDHKKEIRHKFRQIRWYQIAGFLEKYMDNDPYLYNYYNFLKHFNMAQKNTFSPEMIISMENMKDTIETVKIHIENARPYFEEIFNIKNTRIQEASTGTQDRVACFVGDIFQNGGGWTEILYCVKVSLVKLQTQIFINKSHPQMELLKQKIKSYEQEGFRFRLKFTEHPAGYLIYTDRKLYDLINDPEADDKIKNWFIDSFNAFASFIKSTPELDWSIKLNSSCIFEEYKSYLENDDYSPSTVHLYATLAKNVIEKGFEKKGLEFESDNKELENLRKMEGLTYGDHGENFKGKHSFRRFINLKIVEVEKEDSETVPS